MLGKTISHYKILEKLGEGGMGVVYKGHDTKLQRTVAIKVLKPEVIGDPEAKERFIREARAASALNHPNITTIHEIDEWQGRDFIVMEYVEGQTVKEKVKSGPLPMDEVLDIATQTAEALKEAHEHDIIHRDIKSDNIMVTEKGQVKVTDFGLAKLKGMKTLTKAGTTMGTVAYMSPEQAKGKEVDHRSDIWSFGVVLYEMITGQLPFKGEYEQAVIYSILNERPEPVTGLRSGVPMELERIIDKALKKKIEERHQTFNDVLIDLKRDTSKVSRETSPFASVKYRKILNYALLLSGIIALAIAVFLFFPKKKPKPTENRVVVGIFENKTGEPSLDLIGHMTATWITQGLFQTGLVQVIPVTAMRSTDTELTGANLLRALAKEADARTIVSGVYYLLGDTIQFQAQIIDARADTVLHAIHPIIGHRKKQRELIEMLWQRVVGAVATMFDPLLLNSYKGRLGSMQMPTFEAYQQFYVGEQLKMKGKWNEAIKHYHKAFSSDTTFFLSLYLAASLYMNFIDFGKADSINQFLSQDREKLSIAFQYGLDMQRALIIGDFLAALPPARQFAQLAFPAKYMQGLTALKANYLKESVETFSSYDNEAGYWKGWSVYWAFYTSALHLLGNYEQELKEARRGRGYYPDRVDFLSGPEIRALAALGRINEVNQLLESIQVTSNIGGRMLGAASEFRAHGYQEATIDLLERAIKWYQSRPTHRLGLARAYYQAERWDEAYEIFNELIKENPTNVNLQGHLGALAARKGDRKEAEKITQWLKENEPKYWKGRTHIYWQACIASLLGDKERAVNLLREALKTGLEYPMLHADMDLEPLKDYPPFQKLMKPKD
ncbi:MAG: protein kinase [Candidatus Hodarchaeota archaeon]